MAYYAHINSKNNLTGIDTATIIADEYGSTDVQNIEVTEDVYNNARQYGANYYKYDNGEIVLNPDYEAEQQAKEDEEFNIQFFNTSLGYVRRAVTMQNGNIKDFLCDILPLLKVGIPILTYDRQLNQSKVLVTEQFISECQNQVLIDFYGVPNGN